MYLIRYSRDADRPSAIQSPGRRSRATPHLQDHCNCAGCPGHAVGYSLEHAIPGISERHIGELAIARSAELKEAQQKISSHVFKLLGLKLPKAR